MRTEMPDRADTVDPYPSAAVAFGTDDESDRRDAFEKIVVVPTGRRC